MNRTGLWATAAAAMLASGVAVSGVDPGDFSLRTTENLYDLCSVTRDHPDYAPALYACRSFLEATVQYHDAVSDRKHLKRLICYPRTATVADGRAAFLRWAENNAGNQARMDELAVIGLVRALAEAYPCR